MTRIVAGEYGGRRLLTPPGDSTRPTSERTREALFASLTATHDLQAGPFIDLYAGSGAVGLEALSRGAPSVVLVEQQARAADTIRRNIEALKAGERARLLVIDAGVSAARIGPLGAATVFADPPYAVPGAALREVLVALLQAGSIDRDALLIIERERREQWEWPEHFEGLRDRRYGEARLWYGRPL